MTKLRFLPGVSSDYVLDRLRKSPGRELDSGKFFSPDSSAALATNVFGWFRGREAMLPPLPGLRRSHPPLQVEVEYEARLPWSGGTHPRLDAAVLTKAQLVGIESKRFEPFRDKKTYQLSLAYDRPEWSAEMAAYQLVCKDLRCGALRYQHLDATQLVKHALGLASHAARRGLAPTLVYLYAEPSRLRGKEIPSALVKAHRKEIRDFAQRVKGAEVRFHAVSYREWIATWDRSNAELSAHADNVLAAFNP